LNSYIHHPDDVPIIPKKKSSPYTSICKDGMASGQLFTIRKKELFKN